MTQQLRSVLWALLAAATCWCAGCPAAATCPATAVPVGQLVSEYNANAAKVPRLWARASIDVQIAREEGLPVTWGTDNGLLLFKKGDKPLGPHDFVLIGRETAAIELFRVGASTAEGLYYFWYLVGDNSGGFFGRSDLAGGPGREMLLDPMGLMSLLQITELPSDPTSLPAVALEMDSGQLPMGMGACHPTGQSPCAYVLTYIDRQPVTGRILFKRKVYFTWSDKEPRRPFRVDFIAPDGRCVVTATLKDYRPIAETGPAGQEAVMPTDIEMKEVTWPGRVSHLKYLHLRLQPGLTALAKGHGDPVDAARLEPKLPQALKGKMVDVDDQPLTGDKQ